MTLNRPEIKGDWAVFRNSVPRNYNYISCDNTVSGICERADTLEECIGQCEDNSHVCDFGYYISSPEKYCLPINNYRYPHFSPDIDLVPQESVPEIKGIDVYTFINRKSSSKDPENPSGENVPDPYSNTVFFRDRVYLKNTETQTSLYTPRELITERASEMAEISFDKDFASSLTVNYSNPYNPGIILNDLAYNGLFAIGLGDTNMIMRNFGKGVGWISRGNIEISPRDLLRIKHPGGGRPPVHISYGSPFYIEYGTEASPETKKISGGVLEIDKSAKGILGLDENNRLKVYNDGFENLRKNKVPVTFVFESRMSVYYCEGGLCKEIPQSELEQGKSTSLYKGRRVYRSPACFGMCGTVGGGSSLKGVGKEGGLRQKILYILLAGLVLIYLACLWFGRRGR